MFEFYKDNQGKESIGSVPALTPGELLYVARLDGCSNTPLPNDEARSVRLIGTPANTVLTVWDNSCGSIGEDDWCTIATTQDIPPDESVFIPTFEQTETTPYYVMQYHRVNGLDGKISLVAVSLGTG